MPGQTLAEINNLGSRLHVLNSDKRAIFTAASKALQAVTYFLPLRPF